VDKPTPRWSGVRLWVYRSTIGLAPYAVIVRRSDGDLQRDTLVSRGGIVMDPADRESVEPHYALLAAFVNAQGTAWVQSGLDSLTAAQQLRRPRGDHRGNRAY
jgi:hypothetical protein